MRKIFLILIILLMAAPCYAESVLTYGGNMMSSETYAARVGYKLEIEPVDLTLGYRYARMGEVTLDEHSIGVGYDPIVNEWLSLWFDIREKENTVSDKGQEFYLGGGPKLRRGEMDISYGVIGYIDDLGRKALHSVRVRWKSGRLYAQLSYKHPWDNSSGGMLDGGTNVTLADWLKMTYDYENSSGERPRQTAMLVGTVQLGE